MSNKSGVERAADFARNAKSIKKILEKLIQGGWGAAAKEAVKQYWPLILGIVCAFFLIVVILFFAFPLLFLFGGWGSSSSSTQGGGMAVYDNVEQYYDESLEQAVNEAKGTTTNGSQYTETDETDVDGGANETTVGAVATSGTQMQKYWLAAIHTVYLQNNPDAATNESVRGFVENSVDYSVAQTVSDEYGTVDTINAQYLTPDELMDRLKFNDIQRESARETYESLVAQAQGGS